ncbi:MAG: cytochrome c biogenesis protein CcdA [Ktedonobacterales bacterium]
MTTAAVVYAFVAGLASFLSPCVLPLVPVYVAQLVGPSIWHGESAGDGGTGTGTGASEGSGGSLRRHMRTLLQAASFVAGFGLTFIALGATASVLGSLLVRYEAPLREVGGIALVLFGLHVAGIIRVPGLERERRFYLRAGAPGHASSFAIGVVFAFGWTPCVGPYLASILVLAAQARTLGSGVGLLAVYALGLGLPFLAVGAAFDRLAPALKRLAPYLGAIERTSGLLLAGLGVAIFFNWLLVISSWFRIPV